MRTLVCLSLALVGLILLPHAAAAQASPLAAGYWTRGVSAGWGHSWRFGVPGWHKTRSGVGMVAFHPQLGHFVTDHLEIFGEGTLFVYHGPETTLGAGATGLGGRYHFWSDRRWTPFLSVAPGLLWTTLDIPELDRTFNFQLHYGIGLRVIPPRGPGLMVELRNHHLSNAGTAGENLGLNMLTLVAGVQWVLR